MGNLKLSIISINLNNEQGLRKTIESVISQTFTNFEYIVIDGASIDASVGVINEFSEKLTYWISEPDKGIYNAMNKGILKAKGEYLLFLNSGDWLADNLVVENFYRCSLKNDIIAGNCWLVDKKQEILLYKSKEVEDIDYEHFFKWESLPHQATFIRKRLFDLYGLYNEDLKILSDTEFVFKMLILNNVSYAHWDQVISFFDRNGISSDKNFEYISRKEREFIFTQSLPLVYKSYKKLYEVNLSLDEMNKEYKSLKEGKLKYLFKFILFVKQKMKDI